MIPAFVAVIFGLAAGYAVARFLDRSRIQQAKSDAEEILNSAKKEAETIKKEALLQAKDKLFQARTDLENEIKERRGELLSRESRLLHKEEILERKGAQLEQKEASVARRDREIEATFKHAKDKEREAEGASTVDLRVPVPCAAEEFEIRLSEACGAVIDLERRGIPYRLWIGNRMCADARNAALAALASARRDGGPASSRDVHP